MDYNKGYWSAALIPGTATFLLFAFFYTLEAWFGSPSIPDRPFFGEPLLWFLAQIASLLAWIAQLHPWLSFLQVSFEGAFWVLVNTFGLGAVGGLVVQSFIVSAVRRRAAGAPAPAAQKAPAEPEADA